MLEVAAGSGWAAATLARDAPHLRVLATDFAPAMVALARARGVEARVADAAALGAAFDAATFDAVLSLFGVLVLPPAVRDAALRSAPPHARARARTSQVVVDKRWREVATAFKLPSTCTSGSYTFRKVRLRLAAAPAPPSPRARARGATRCRRRLRR